MEAISSQLNTVIGNKTFRSLFTIGTVGFGSWLLWTDWTSKKGEITSLEEEGDSKCMFASICSKFPKILLFCILDNSTGLAYQQFCGHNDESWNNHFKAAVIQYMLACPVIKGKLKSMKCCPYALLTLSLYFQCKGWWWFCGYLFGKK